MTNHLRRPLSIYTLASNDALILAASFSSTLINYFSFLVFIHI
jgi:hypothetical protein